MNKKFIVFIALVVVFTSVACGFTTNFSLPGLRTARTATPVSIAPAQVITATPAVVPNLDISGLQDRDQVLTALYQRVSPGVVSILATIADSAATGSGFVYDLQGHIITNYHVIEDATDLEVDFPSGLKTRAEIVGTDLDSDLAVLKVDVAKEDLHPVPVGDSNQLTVGQTVIAIGNPFGLNGTMTVGIVSAKGRTLESMRESSTSGSYFTAADLIQTDAAINPGNSGGPLLNLNGEVVGVNRAIRTDGTNTSGEPTNSGIGFAVASNIITRVVPELIDNGKYEYPYMGLSSQEDFSLDVIEELNLPRQTGVYITAVVDGGPADKAGLQAGTRQTSYIGLNAGGDLIVAIDGQPVDTFNEMLSYLVYNKKPGDQVVMTIIRDNQEKEVTITLGKRP
jgi:S1-C subfamily serine protease